MPRFGRQTKEIYFGLGISLQPLDRAGVVEKLALCFWMAGLPAGAVRDHFPANISPPVDWTEGCQPLLVKELLR